MNLLAFSVPVSCILVGAAALGGSMVMVLGRAVTLLEPSPIMETLVALACGIYLLGGGIIDLARLRGYEGHRGAALVLAASLTLFGGAVAWRMAMLEPALHGSTVTAAMAVSGLCAIALAAVGLVMLYAWVRR